MTQEIEKRIERLEKKVGLTKTTRILVIQDKSGSMYSRQNETITGFNEYLEDLQKDDSDEAFLTLIQFNVRYDTVIEADPVDKVEPLTSATYTPSGGTALFDAVGRGITDLKKELEDGERALVIIMTDGMENSSSEYTSDSIKSLVKDCEKKDNWTFVFLGAGQSAWSGGKSLGLGRRQSVFYGEDAFSHDTAYAGLSQMTSQLRGGTSMSSAAPGEDVSQTMASLGADVQIKEEKPLWTPESEINESSEEE
jgi:hypothetical protein